jgi:hypothetical protein
VLRATTAADQGAQVLTGDVDTLMGMLGGITNGAEGGSGHPAWAVALANLREKRSSIARAFVVPIQIGKRMSSAEQWVANARFLDRTIAGRQRRAGTRAGDVIGMPTRSRLKILGRPQMRSVLRWPISPN